MSKVKTDFRSKTVTLIIAFARNIIIKLTGNLIFNIDPAKLTALTNACDASELQIGKAAAAKQTSLEETAKEKVAMKVVTDAITGLANEVNSVTTDEVELLTSGYPLADTPGVIQPLGQVMSLQASEGDHEGEIDLDWDSLKGATGYTVLMSDDPPGVYQIKKTGGRISKMTIKGLTSGKAYWFRVYGVRGEEEGPESDPATKRAP